jgi:septal ring factor EnvC (AmiA/AmiB activator)
MSTRLFTLTLFVMGLFMVSGAAYAPTLDLDSCHDDLDRVRRAAADASEAADDAHTKQEDFETCKRDEERCAGQRSDLDSAISDVEDKMDTLDSRIRSTQDSCNYNFTVNRMSAMEASQRHLETSKRRFCASLRKLVTLGVSPADALRTCQSGGDAQVCKACLGVN